VAKYRGRIILECILEKWMEICKMNRSSSGWGPKAGFCECNHKTLNCSEACNLLAR
jgi:hypothetical protein